MADPASPTLPVVPTNWYLLFMLELGLKGKVAIVTGGSEGLGRAYVSAAF